MRVPTFVLLLLAPASAAWAETANLPDTGSSILQMLFGLAIVLAMLFGTLWVLKRLSLPRGPGSGLMRVVAGIPVGPRERVVLLEIGTSWLVLGVAQGQVSTLAEVPRQEVPPGNAPEGARDFAGWVKQITERRRDPNA
jgi:flagellar protein FliO/FliZ